MLAGGGDAPRFVLSGGQDLTKGAYSKADAVYGELKEAILSGALGPGSLIDKTGLCEKLRVSRFPVSAAARRMSRADKDALAANLRQQVAAVAEKDRATFYGLDVAFHQLLTTRLGMARSADVLESLRVHLERTRRLTMFTAEQLRASLNEHTAIAAAIEAEDPTAACDAMKQHLRITAARLEDLAKRQPELFSP